MISVYLMTSADNKNVYVGSTQDPKRRFLNHMSQCKHNRHSNRHVQALHNLIGREGFELDVLSEHATRAEALEHEQAWVDYYKAHPTVWNLLNIATVNVDAPTSNPEVAAKTAAANRGSKRSAASRAKMSAAKKGKTSPMKGKKQSAESKAKIAAAKKGKGIKPIYVRWADGTERTFPTGDAAGKHIGVSGTLVVHWIKGKSTTQYRRGINEVCYA